jgi:hypothetical protein
MSRDISISAEVLMAFYIIATGEFDGVCWVNYPKLPTPFCENVKIGNEVGDLLSLRVDPNDSKLRVQLWFMDERENSFFFTWEEVVQLKPTLAAVVFTHVYDMIENVK